LSFFTADQWLRNCAVETVRAIIADPAVKVAAGLELYASRPDKGYSLADCISMQVMRREHIADAMTNDQHFEQEGFRALFRSVP